MVRWVSMVVALGMMLDVSPAFAQQAAPGADASDPPPTAHVATYADWLFDAFVARYFKGYMDANPTQATEFGFHDGHDTKLPDFSRGALGREVIRLHAAFKELSSLDPTNLSRDHAIDRRFLLASIQAGLLDLLSVRSWQTNPRFYNDTIASSINTLAKRNFASPEERLRDVVARERAIPVALSSARENLDNPPRLLGRAGRGRREGHHRVPLQGRAERVQGRGRP